MRRWWCCLWLIALTVMVAARPAGQDRPTSRSPAESPASSPWTAYVARFLAEPEHDGDLSDTAFAEDLVRTRARLAELRAIEASGLSKDEAIDRRFVEALLARREIDQAQMRRWRMDPRVYMQSIR